MFRAWKIDRVISVGKKQSVRINHTRIFYVLGQEEHKQAVRFTFRYDDIYSNIYEPQAKILKLLIVDI